MDIAVIIGEIAYISRERIIDGIVDTAKKDGSNVILFTCEGFLYHDLPEYSNGEYSIFTLPDFENYDGIIVDFDSIQNIEVREYIVNKVKNTKVPCVSFNSNLGTINEIVFDNEKGFRRLIEHLINEHKLTDIHYISGPFGNADAVQRLNIFKDTLEKHGLCIKDEDIYEGDFNFNGGIMAAKKYISTGKKLPQAFVAANDFMAIGLMEELKSNGIRIPEDVVITGYDNCEIADYTSPRITTVDRGEYESGVFAYECLSNKTNGSKVNRVIVEGKPVISESCGCLCDKRDGNKNSPSVVNMKIHMDASLDLIKGMTITQIEMGKLIDFEHGFEKYIERIGMEYFYFCQCGSRESYYDELEILASGREVDRDVTKYQDTVWCPIAYENGEWTSYPSYSSSLLFPPNSKRKHESSYYIVMPVHQGEVCIGYSIIGNFHDDLSGRVIQHLVLGIDEALSKIRKNDIMTTMLARINQKWKYDELTGLYNRSGLVNNADKLIDEANKNDKGISVIFYDLDGLKAINDSKGHDAGDLYIKSMADILINSTNEDDIVCRYGGDEYIVVTIEDSVDASLETFNRITSNIHEPILTSAGYAFGHISRIDELNRLIEMADKSMYENKKKKKKQNL